MKTMKMMEKKSLRPFKIRSIITKILGDQIHETSSCLEVDIAARRVWVLISPMASSSCHHDDPTVWATIPYLTWYYRLLLFRSWFMIYTKVGNRYLSDVPILTRMMIIGWGFLQSIGQLKESKIPIIKFLTVPSSTVHLLVRKWDNGQKRRRRSLQRKSLSSSLMIS